MIVGPEEVPPTMLDITAIRGPIAADTIDTLADRAAVTLPHTLLT